MIFGIYFTSCRYSSGKITRGEARVLFRRSTENEWNMYRLLHAFECNTDIILRGNGEVISRGEAECNLAISE